MNILVSTILAILSFYTNNSTDTEVKYFDVVVHNKVVGELKATKSLENGLTVYRNYTDIKTHIIKDITVSYYYEVSFLEERLTKADATVIINDKIHEKTETNWMGENYLVQQYEKDEKYFDDTISNSVVVLLIEEPVTMQYVYSELSGSLHKITALGNHAYLKTNEKGKKNYYYYSNGELDRVKVDAGLLKFEIVRKKD